MDSVITKTALISIVEREVKRYVRPSMDGLMVYVSNARQQTYGVVWLTGNQRMASHLVVMVRIVDDKVIVHSDNADYPLVDELIHAGILREQIHVAYRGEPALISDNQSDADFQDGLIN